MKYYKDINNEVYAYEDDGSQDYLIGDKVQMTAEEVEAHINPPKTQEQIAQEAREARAAAMLEGDVYALGGVDYRVSFTSDDGNGMLQVKAAFDIGLTATTIHFANGTNMPIASSEYLAFAQWFATKRNEFFV